ncbi:Nucleotidyltransferase [Lactarius sanguifluus]|nr:Nucleotidyltransferase [Lactarius sanguifluus]
MAPKRAGARSPSPSLSSTASPVRRPPKRAKTAPGILASHRLYILHTKLAHKDISELHDLAEKADADLVSSPDEADVVVTAIGMRKRLERHIDWNLAKTKALVKPDWLRDSVEQGHPLPCTDYAALSDLKEATEEHCPRSNSQSVVTTLSKSGSLSTSSRPPSRAALTPPAFLLPPSKPPSPVELDHTAHFCCSRASPLVCPNQALCAEFDVLRRSRVLESNERSALSYARAIAAIKAFPRVITESERRDVQKLPFIGTKVSKMVDEYLFTGHIAEVEEIKQSERFTSLSLFASIYGIGPTTSRKLYDLGLRTLRDLDAYYEVDASTPVEHSGSADMDVRIALGLRDDFQQTISREEVEAIHATIMDHLNAVEPGCVSTLVGGYRRGKPSSNDVDIVFTHPNKTSAKGLCTKLVERLRSADLVKLTHADLSSFHEHDALRTAQWDSLEKALTVYRPHNGLHRRVDLICAIPETYWTAVIGWTGGTMFERDLRMACEIDVCSVFFCRPDESRLISVSASGLKFDSTGITRRQDSKLFYPRSEKEVFDIIGLPWVDPTLRNTDA